MLIYNKPFNCKANKFGALCDLRHWQLWVNLDNPSQSYS